MRRPPRGPTPMLTDEELTTRLSAAFHESVPELTYAGPVPQVRRNHTGLMATSALAAAAALVLMPAALQRGEDGASRLAPSANPGEHESSSAGRHVYTLDLGGVRRSFASSADDPGDIYFMFGPDMTLPPDVEKLDLGLPYDVWLVDNPASGQPQIYIGHRVCPDTEEGCNGQPPPLE